MEPAQRRLAERLLVTELRRFHRREPLVPDIRTDALVARVRAAGGDPRPATHRGVRRLAIDDAALRDVIDGLVAGGVILRSGHRLRLAAASTQPDSELRERVDRLLGELRAAGASPARTEQVAQRLGLPHHVLSGLRRGGQLVNVAPGIDYPADVYATLTGRIRDIAASRPLSVAIVRDALGCSRRHAAALLKAIGRA